MSSGDKELAISIAGIALVFVAAFITIKLWPVPQARAKAEAVHLEQNPPIPVLPEVVPLVPPLNKDKMVEIYERAFFECNTQYHMSVEERHKFAMGAVQTAPSRYNQLMQEIAKHDEN